MAYNALDPAAGRLMADDSKSALDYLGMLSRRRWYALLPAIAVLTASFLLAVLLPPVYRSSSTILIEEPDVPKELVLSTISGFVDDRIQAITQRVLASQNLIALIEQYDLYPDARARLPMGEVVDAMRQDIRTELISADTKDLRGNRASQATIAFKVSFDHRDPETAQKVANELASLYLNENQRERQNKAAETSGFLTTEAQRLEKLIADQESRIATLKAKYSGSLPEQMDYNLQLINRAESELRDLDRRAEGLDQQRIYLEAELMKISPYGSYVVDGQRVMSPVDQLKALRTQYITLSGQYGPNHPDVVKLRRSVEALEKNEGYTPDRDSLLREQERLRTELATLSERYSASHPDVVKLKRNLDAVDAALAQTKRKPILLRAESAQPDNPAYIQLQAQLQATRTDLKTIRDQRGVIRAEIAEVEKRVIQTPGVEREYAQLKRDYETAQQEYHSIREKQTLAQMGETLETERKSERFSIIEPPLVPTRAIKPNRLAILALGLVLSVGAGVGAAAVTENLDKTVRSSRQLSRVTGSAPLAVIPYLRRREDVAQDWRRRLLITAAVIAFIAMLLVIVDALVVPLDVLYAQIRRHF